VDKMEFNKVYNMDCLEGLKLLDDNSVDAIITDPPYELGFMGKKWDSTGIAYNVDLWRECLRVLKPGGHLLAFGGTRTYHRMAVAIEDAGFEVRDMLEWIYASGFPKSLNVGKAVDKIAPRLGQFDEFAKHLTEQIKESGKTQKEIASLFPSKTGGLTGCVWNWANGANVPTVAQWNILKPLLNLSDDFFPLIERIEREREVIGKMKLPDGHSFAGERYTDKNGSTLKNITKGNSEWEGFGTALKPAHEPIIMARKPLSEKTIVENVLKHGTGAIDIDGCRIPTSETLKEQKVKGSNGGEAYGDYNLDAIYTPSEQGRFPANIICTDDALNTGKDESRYFSIDVWAEKHGLLQFPKASKKDRGEGNNHPTVKPVHLMSWLVRLVTPKNGLILDPFTGSGTTGVACKKLNRQFVGIEMNKEYCDIANKRLEQNNLKGEIEYVLC